MATQREGREWFVLADDYETDEDYRVAVQQELAGLENMGHRLGRGFVVTPLRQQREIGGVTVYETVGWAFSETFMPAVRSAPVEPLAHELLEREPVEA